MRQSPFLEGCGSAVGSWSFAARKMAHRCTVPFVRMPRVATRPMGGPLLGKKSHPALIHPLDPAVACSGMFGVANRDARGSEFFVRMG